MGKTWMLAVAATLLAAPAVAQQEAQHCMALMGGPPPQMLLVHGDALELNADQVSRLEALQARARETVEPAMQQAMESHRAAAGLMEGDRPDFDAYEARLREAADHMVRGHVAMARVAVETRGVLTPEQQTRLEDLIGGMRGPGQRRMMDERRPGMMGWGRPGMMGCMMDGW